MLDVVLLLFLEGLELRKVIAHVDLFGSPHACLLLLVEAPEFRVALTSGEHETVDVLLEEGLPRESFLFGAIRARLETVETLLVSIRSEILSSFLLSIA